MTDHAHQFAVLDESGTIINVVVVDDDNVKAATDAGWLPIDNADPQPWIGWSTADAGKSWSPDAATASGPARKSRSARASARKASRDRQR